MSIELMSLCVVVALLLLGGGTTTMTRAAQCDCLDSMSRVLCARCWTTCRLASSHVDRVADHLRRNLFGQDAAVADIVSGLARHVASTSGGPYVFHLTGDNGVGKTLATRLVAEARFASSTYSAARLLFGAPRADAVIDGLLYIRGESYREENATQIRQHRRDLRHLIAEYLHRCPDALVVIDEVEKVHRTTMAVLQEFTDNKMPIVHYAGNDS